MYTYVIHVCVYIFICMYVCVFMFLSSLLFLYLWENLTDTMNKWDSIQKCWFNIEKRMQFTTLTYKKENNIIISKIQKKYLTKFNTHISYF